MAEETGAQQRPGRGEQPAGSSAPAPAPGPTVPSRRWEMTSQEHDMMARFRQDFLDLLDGRVAKVEKLVLTAQLEPAHVALLSLESSSAMMGRTELAAAARQLRSALTQASPGELDALLAEVIRHAEAARRQLESSEA